MAGVDNGKTSDTATSGSESLDEGEFLVENVIDKRLTKEGKPFYFVKWVGYGSKENTWEPLENLSKCTDLVAKFEEKLQRKAMEKKKGKGKKSGSVKTPKAKPKPVDDSDEDEREIHLNVWDPEVYEAVNSGNYTQEEWERYCYGKTFRKTWRKSEEPLCILGSAVREDVELHLVRLKPSSPEEVQKALEDVDEGVTVDNSVVVIAKDFNKWFPQIVISYYQGRVEFHDNDKTDEENTRAVARAAIFHQFQDKQLHVNAAPIFKDMMDDVPGFDKESDDNEYFLDKCGNPEPYVDKTKKDGFGLPEFYSSSEESGNDGEGEKSSESSGEENGYEEIKVSLKKKKRNVVKH